MCKCVDKFTLLHMCPTQQIHPPMHAHIPSLVHLVLPCCSVVQCCAVWRKVLQCVAAFCALFLRLIQCYHVAVSCGLVQYSAMCCSVLRIEHILQCVAVSCENMFCSVLQCAAHSFVRSCSSTITIDFLLGHCEAVRNSNSQQKRLTTQRHAVAHSQTPVEAQKSTQKQRIVTFFGPK